MKCVTLIDQSRIFLAFHCMLCDVCQVVLDQSNKTRLIDSDLSDRHHSRKRSIEAVLELVEAKPNDESQQMYEI